MYQFDLHCHTKGVSKCGTVLPEEGARLYIEAGYSGVVITNHFNRYTFDVMPEGSSWDETMDFYLSGWKRFRDAAGERLTVLLGMEIRFDENENDYLVYGVTEELLRAHPEFLEMDAASFSALPGRRGCCFIRRIPSGMGCRWLIPNFWTESRRITGIPAMSPAMISPWRGRKNMGSSKSADRIFMTPMDMPWAEF